MPHAILSRMSKTLCIFSALYRPHIGGVETFTRNLALELARQGVHVLVVTCQLAPEHPQRENDEGIEVLRLPCRPLMNARFPVLLQNADARSLWDEIDAAAPDYVIINTRFYPLSLAAARFCAERHVRPVVIDHGSAHLTVGSGIVDAGVQAVEHALTRKLKAYPADFYGISDASVTWLRHFGIQACGTITNAIDAAAFAHARSGTSIRHAYGIALGDFLVCSVGRLAPEKGCRQLVEAARMLADEAPTIKFVFAGGGPLDDELRQCAPSNVCLTGPLAPPDVAELLIEANLLCLPTRSEGFCTALLEAAACETPALITRVGGTAELIPTCEFGNVLADAEPSTIAQRIRELADDPNRCAAQGRAARARTEELFSWHVTAARALEACERAQRGQSEICGRKNTDINKS